MRKLFCTALIIVAALFSKAQDPNFSQFFASPLTLNPALTGKFDGEFRLAGNYRNQWPTINNAFTTYTASFDIGILKDRIPEYDQFGIGVMGFSDKAANGILRNNFAAVSVSYHKALDENGYNQLGLGFQGTYTNKRLDVYNKDVTFLDQLTANGFTGVTSEIFDQKNLNVSYFDMNAGVLYNGTTNGTNSFYVGASMYHINRPKESFQGGQYYLNPRLTLQAGGMFPKGEYDAVHFSAIHSRQANAVNTVIGGAYMMNLNSDPSNPTNLYLGSWLRFGDAVIPYIGLEFNSMRIGASYDVNISSLKPGSNMRGGAEFSLIYVKPYSDPNRKKLNCPVF
jgi:type IX secretion system PorP/SprF family membrane protein